MNVGFQNLNRTLLANTGGMKSTQDKMERQEKCASQVSFFEKQKENLKTMACSSLEEIARKLEMFHSYEDQIAAAKKAYNNSQMMSVLDEARERGEKIAEAAEEAAPKTPEERKEEMLEEAADSEESKGMLTELMEEMTETVEEMTEEMTEEMLEENLEESAADELAEGAAESLGDETIGGAAPDSLEEVVEQNLLRRQEEDPGISVFQAFDEKSFPYRHIDYRL